MMKTRNLILFLILISNPSLLHARVFSFKDAIWGTYLSGSYGTNRAQRTAYSDGFPSSVTFTGGNVTSLQFGAEFGAMFVPSKSFGLRVGVELLNPQQAKDNSGRDVLDTELLTLTSDMYSVIPNVLFDFYYKEISAGARLFMGAGAGYAYTTIKNTVTVNSTGQQTLNLTDYVEEGTSVNITYKGYMGIEAHFVDALTTSLEIGYRSLVADSFTSGRDSVTANGTVKKGETLKNVNGANRSVNLTGPYGSLMFRFYF